MKFRTTKNWDEPDKKNGLLYTAQMLEELTYPLTMSTYKPSIMHTALLCIEANDTIEEIEAGNIQSPNIDHVLEELCYNLESDPIAARLITVPRRVLFATLKDKKVGIKEKQLTVNLLLTQLDHSKYLETCERIILEQLTTDPDYKLLRTAIRSYVTTLMSSGTSQKHIHDIALEHFHYSNDRVGDANSCAREFFAKVRPERSSYIVVFKVDQIFQSVKNIFAPLKVVFSNEIPEGIDATLHPAFFKKNQKVTVTYAKIADIEARDKYQAKDFAEYMLRACSTFLTLFHHREKPSWRSDTVVFEGSKAHLIGTSDNAMHHGDDLKPEVAAKRIASFFEKFSLGEKAFIKFIRGAQLHSLAVVSSSIENQILNLWIAIESLVPSETRNDEATISHIVKSLIPILNYQYIEKLANSAVKDLLIWNKSFFYSIVKGIVGKSFTERLLKVLALPEYSDRRDLLEQKCGHFVLLRDRLSRLQWIFASPQNCADTLASHAIRVGWQIRRIYRTRNIIVHSGTTPAHTRAIIEHAHEYLDAIFNVLIKMASRPTQIKTVAEGFKLAQLHYDSYLATLNDANTIITSDNIVSIYFMRATARF